MSSEKELRARLGRAIVSFSDMQEARSSLVRLQELDEFGKGVAHRTHDFIAHSTCLVVAYCRPFGRNRSAPHNASKLPAEYLSDFTDGEATLHERMKELRDSEFAHADAEAHGLQFSIQRGRAGNIAMPVHRVLRKSLTQLEAELLSSMITKILARLSRDLHEIPNALDVDVGVPPFVNPTDVS